MREPRTTARPLELSPCNNTHASPSIPRGHRRAGRALTLVGLGRRAPSTRRRRRPQSRDRRATRSPYYIGASQAFTHDSNIFRVADECAETADAVSTTALLAGIDQPFGRQRGFGNAHVRYNKYQDQSQLDNTSYRLAAGLDWETVERLSRQRDAGAGARTWRATATEGSTARERSATNAGTSESSIRGRSTAITAAVALYGLGRLPIDRLHGRAPSTTAHEPRPDLRWRRSLSRRAAH